MQGYGIDAIIAGSYAGIFADNCQNIGLVGIQVSPEQITELSDFVVKNPSTEFTIDLNEKLLTYGSNSMSFDIPEGKRQAFLTGGWDAMTPLLKNEEGIANAEKTIDYLAFK